MRIHVCGEDEERDELEGERGGGRIKVQPLHRRSMRWKLAAEEVYTAYNHQMRSLIMLRHTHTHTHTHTRARKIHRIYASAHILFLQWARTLFITASQRSMRCSMKVNTASQSDRVSTSNRSSRSTWGRNGAERPSVIHQNDLIRAIM